MKLVPVLEKEQTEFAWWVRITTQEDRCIYYFGPFASIQEAESHAEGYKEDLEEEGSQVAALEIVECQPPELTTCLAA